MDDAGPTYRFAGHVLDLGKGILKASAGEVALRRKSFDLLAYFVRNAGRVVPKDELLDAVWPGVTVTEDSLTQCVSDIRRALGDKGLLLRTVPRRGYVFAEAAFEPAEAAGRHDPADRPGALFDRPSIAVLRFANLSGDPMQDYFADGIAEEIITALSRLRWLSVMARDQSFSYDASAPDVRRIGGEMGVRYMLEGSVRRSDSRLRITARLVDAATGAHLWADRFDGSSQDLFALQDQVTARVVGAIAPTLEQAEIGRALHKPTESLDAYDYFLRGMAHHHRWNGSGNQEALPLFVKAIELDPAFAAAYGMAARCFVQRKAIGLLKSDPAEIVEAEWLARGAGEFGKGDAGALWTGGFTLAYVVGDLDGGAAFIEAALDLDPNLTLAWAASAWVKAWLGLPEEAVEHAAHAMQLRPRDTQLFSMQAATALAHFVAGRYRDALHWAEAAVRERPNFVNGFGTIAASAGMLDDAARAGRALASLREGSPAFRVADLLDHNPFRRDGDRRRWSAGLSRAGGCA